MGKTLLMVLSVPVPWLVFILLGHPVRGVMVVVAVLFMAYVGTLFNSSLLPFLTIVASIVWAMKTVQQQHPAPLSRRRYDDFR